MVEKSWANKNILITKVLSYDASIGRTMYFYPRLEFVDKEVCENIITINGITTRMDHLLMTLNHLIEVLVLSWDDFITLCGDFLDRGLDQTISMGNLLYQVFKEEYTFYLHPILQLTDRWFQVEAPYDRYFLIGYQGAYIYRIHPYKRIECFSVIERDFGTVSYQNTDFENSSIRSEMIYTPTSSSIRSHLR